MGKESYFYAEARDYILEYHPDLALEMGNDIIGFTESLSREADTENFEYTSAGMPNYEAKELAYKHMVEKLGFSYFELSKTIFLENFEETYFYLESKGSLELKLAEFVSANKESLRELEPESRELYYTILSKMEENGIHKK